MLAYPFDCLLVGNHDRDVDELVAAVLTRGGHMLARVRVADLLAALQARPRPAVIVAQFTAPTEQWQSTFPALVAASELTRRYGYVLLTGPHARLARLVAQLPAVHDVTILALPYGLPQLLPTVERVGRRVASRWEPSS